ncbi:pupal cuticle protein 36-like isoform X1 [Vanessa atalanta]|uniref:pupal cuticle protein 36-like isoform X1 n=1 Tax=Vanessa atalanta TaxID=42275 RepID=UPI001FCD2F22|nr:pupal cuticle protein 36-like isoform X1 [Vanessa atalanta]
MYLLLHFQLIVLSVIACGYADKLDRTYLPPKSAATAGGSPGALTAPGFQSGTDFGQGLPSGSGRQPGAAGFDQSSSYGFGQGPSGSARPSSANGFGFSDNAQSNNGFGPSKLGGTSRGSSSDSAFESRVPSTSAFALSQIGTNDAGFGQSNAFNQGLGSGPSGPNVAQVSTPERAQASADRNAEILKYINENNGESYRYSYETSNGIFAEESGEATNGVRAQGGYSYTGDDGKTYSVTYTADENGYQPQGEHLPTPHPIPEEILRSIEENARAAAAGTQEGAYRPEEYESEPQSPQQYNTGSTFNQGQNFGSAQGFQSAQGQAGSQPQNNKFTTNQGVSGRPSGPSGQYGEVNQGLTTGVSQASQGQGQDVNGFKQSQNGFGSTGQGSIAQYRPQINKPTSYSAGSTSTGSGSNTNADAFGFGNKDNQFGQANTPSSGNQFSSGSTSNQGQVYQSSLGSQGSSFGSQQGSQYKPENQPIGSAGSSGQGTRYQSNENVFNAGQSSTGQNTQYGPSAGSNTASGQSISYNGNQNSQSSSPVGRGPQYQQNGNQAGSNVGTSQGTQAQFASGNKFASGASGSAGSAGSAIQAPYQYNRPGQSFETKPQSPFNNAGSRGTNGVANQDNQRGIDQFGGPRQPPSFSPQEGYKY